MGKFIKVTNVSTGKLELIGAGQIEQIKESGSGAEILLSQDTSGIITAESLADIEKYLGSKALIVGREEPYNPTVSAVTFTIKNSADNALLGDVTILFNGEEKDTNASGVAVFYNVPYGTATPYSLVKSTFTTVVDSVDVDAATEAVIDTMTSVE